MAFAIEDLPRGRAGLVYTSQRGRAAAMGEIVMRVTVVGLGYVGLVTAACLAEWDHDVVGIDANPERLDALRDGRMPFHEPRLQVLVTESVANGSLSFASDLPSA